jgi:hypothetical protein
MVKRVLMVAYHFPPMNVSSGIQRTLRFAQYLPEFNWQPSVLTAHPRAYSDVSAASLAEIPADLHVQRAFALDTAKHLSLRGAYPHWLALPDRWWSWWLGAVPAGLRLIHKLKPDALWSTYPIATAHFIAYALHRITGIRWVADFRDPMVEPGYPSDRLQRAAYDRIERMTLKHCVRAVFASPGALRLCAKRHAGVRPSRLMLIENGYDESSFAGAEQVAISGHAIGGALVLVHSGIVYPSERDPRSFFAALSALCRNGTINDRRLKVVLRATANDDYLRGLIAAYGLDHIVTLQPSLPYRAALAEMMAADGLIVLQAANCNNQVPAKLYEYLRARRPILALTDPLGDTAAVLRSAGIDTIAPLDSSEDIARLLVRFLDLLRLQRAPVAPEAVITAASRRSRTMQLANLLDAATS